MFWEPLASFFFVGLAVSSFPPTPNELPALFDCSVFNGEYITGDITEEYLQGLESSRSDNNKAKENNNQDADDESFVALYNDIS